jgi:hypothetical protein
VGLEGWSLVACVVFAGLWAGLTGMLTLVIHRMLAPMSGGEFARFLGAFLPVARTSWFNYLEVAGMVIAPIVALFALGTSAGAPFVLTAIGLALTVAGPLLVSNRLAEPNYDAMLAWDPDAVPGDWLRSRHRYFAYNWIRFVATCGAFGLFIAALVEHLR